MIGKFQTIIGFRSSMPEGFIILEEVTDSDRELKNIEATKRFGDCFLDERKEKDWAETRGNRQT